jgi:hypothetical protein
VELAACEGEADGAAVATHADFRIMPAAGGGGMNRSFADAADAVARAARGHLQVLPKL